MAIIDALLIYPMADANSFITLAEANTSIDYKVDAPLWESQTDDQKKRLLIQAYNDITTLEGIILPVAPDPIPGCLGEVQADTALNYLTNTQTYTDRQVKTEKLGIMSTTYQDIDMLEPDIFTEASVNCLKSFGALEPNSVGAVGSVRKSRY